MLGEPWELQEAGESAAEDVSEFVVWERVSMQERWRIMYLRNRRKGWWNDVIADGFVFEGDAEVLDHRPLIETPAEVRLRASELLPDLLKAIADNVKGPKTRARELDQAFSKALKVLSKKEEPKKKRTTKADVK
ncbi:MAG: hypothetical protein ACLQU2_16070 [Candidatus Binataceae bacterium]